MVWDGELEPLRPEDSISCVGEEGFKSRRRDSPLFDSRYTRSRARAQPPPPLRVVEETYTRPASSSASSKHASLRPRSKPKTTTTTTTTRTVQYREPPVRYVDGDGGSRATLPLRPPHSRKHTSTKHPTIVVEREPSYTSSSTRTSSSRAPPPPRSNDRFYEYRRVTEPADARGWSSLDAGRRSSYVAPRAYSQERGSGNGVYSTLGPSRERGSDTGRNELWYEGRKLSQTGTGSYGEARGAESYWRTGDYRGYGYPRR